ncbi:MAG: hypothetical protein R2729_32465 [Bryobacteraceae bacterium]
MDPNPFLGRLRLLTETHSPRYPRPRRPAIYVLVIDLAKIHHRALGGPAAGQTPILDRTEVAMILPVLASVRAAQKHLSRAACQNFNA